MFILFFLCLFVFLLTLLCVLVDNIFVWWSIFLMMTLLFVLLMKSGNNFGALFNYFVIQESLGLLFLVFSFGFFQLLLVLLKIGVAPFHFWIFSVVNDVTGYVLIWFLTFQKLPFFIILLQLFVSLLFYFLFFGLLVCYYQIFSSKNYKNLLVLSSTESFNWIVLGLLVYFLNSFFLFIYYFFSMLVLLNKFNNSDVNFVNWEMALIFMNIPFSVTFFVKIFSLAEVFKFESFFSLMVLFLMFFSTLSFSFWLIILSTKFLSDYSVSSKIFYFLLYPVSFFVLL